MNVIVNTSKDWGIGKNGNLLKYLKPDMKMFRETTSGGVVIMGRKTLESFPNCQPLKNRVNIVISANPDFCCEGAIVCRSPEEALKAAGSYDDEKVYIIGGGSIYSRFLPYCKAAIVTRMELTAEADTYFPNLDNDPNWELVWEGEMQEYEGLRFRFTRYENRCVQEA